MGTMPHYSRYSRYSRYNPRRKKRKLKHVGTMITVAVFLILLFTCIRVFTLFGALQGSATPVMWNPSSDKRTTFLLAGMHNGKLASCTLMSIPAREENPVYLLSVPANTLLEQAGGSTELLAEVFSRQGVEGGIAALNALFSGNIEIGHYLTYNYEVMPELLSSLNGVEVWLESAFSVRQNEVDFVFAQGENTINEENAIPYLCGEAVDGIYREQDLLTAVFSEMFAFNNLGKLIGNLRLVGDHYSSDLGTRNLARFRDTLAAIDRDNSFAQPLPGQTITAQGERYWLPDELALDLLGEQIAQELPGYNRDELAVDLFNGNGVNGFAGRTARQLRERDYTVDVVTDAETLEDTTIIYYQEGFQLAALELALVLECEPEYVQGQYGDHKNPVAIVLGRDLVGR